MSDSNASGPTRRVLVTGGAGFIGSNLIRQLAGTGSEIRVLDNLSVGTRENLAGLPVDLVEGDVRDPDVAASAVEGCDGVVHLAAQTGVPGSLVNPVLDSEVNVGGTLTMLEAVRREQDRRGHPLAFVFASSNAPLGRQEPPATEDKAPLPISPYGASKLAGEGYCLAYAGSWGVRSVVLRFANVYGPFSDQKSSVVAQFFKDVAAHGTVTVDGDGQQTRDFVHVDDLCRAIRKALGSGIRGEVFQIATGRETSIADLAALVQEISAVDVSVAHGEPRRGDVRKNYSSIKKARELLRWSPEVELEEGLQETWRWFQRDGIASTAATA